MNITPTVSLDADVLNLRPDSTGGQLVPVGLPAHIATGNLSPLHQFRHSNGTSTLFLTTGNFLFALSLDGESSTPQSLSVLPSAAKCVIEVGNTIYVMTDDGPFRLDYSSVKGTWTEVGLMPQFPAIRLHAVATSVQSTTIPATQLEGTYSHWSGQLSDADCKTMRTKLLDAYSSLCSQAMYAGSFVQPVMARYQLLDRNGALLYQSAPVMISAGKGFQLSSSLSASVVVGSDGSASVNPITLSADAFRVGFYAPSLLQSPWGGIVHSVKILVSPQLHPIDFNAPLCYRLTSASASAHSIIMYLPGTAIDMAPNDALQTNLAKMATSRINQIATTRQEFLCPYSVGFNKSLYPNGLVMILRGDRTSARNECAYLHKLLNTPISGQNDDYRHALSASISAPHSFTATAATTAGDTIVYGGITPIRYEGYPAPMLAATTTSGGWYANVKVSFNDGNETVVWHGNGDSGAPLTFSPILSYPSPDAREMTITVNYADGTTRSRTVELQRLGDVAIYINPQFLPLELTDGLDAYVIPAKVSVRETHHGSIVSAAITAPFTPLATLLISQSNIQAITPAVKSSSAWDFARTHLYSFSSTGIHAIAINATRDTIAANIIDPRGVTSRHAVTITDNGVLAIASGDLISVAGSRAKTIESDVGLDRIAWCGATRELWGTISDSHQVHIRSDSFRGHYRRDIAVDELLSTPHGQLFLLSGEKILEASAEQPTDEIEVEWTSRFKVKPFRPKRISWHLFASNTQMSLALRGDCGAGRESSLPMLKLNVDGQVNAPISARIYAPPRLYLTLSAKGKISHDAILSEIIIT